MKQLSFIITLVIIVTSCQKADYTTSNSDFCKLVKETELSGGHAATVFTWDGNTRTASNGEITEYNRFGSVVRHVEENGNVLTFEYEGCEKFCRLVRRVEENSLHERGEQNYTWDGNTQIRDDGLIREYNDDGSIIYQKVSNSEDRWEYIECENFCKLIQHSRWSENPHGSFKISYTWDGNTRTSEFGEIVEYNDFGQVKRFENTPSNGYTREYSDCPQQGIAIQ